MKSPLVLCVFLQGVVLSINAASLRPSAEAVPAAATLTTNTLLTTTYPTTTVPAPTECDTVTPTTTTPYPTTTVPARPEYAIVALTTVTTTPYPTTTVPAPTECDTVTPTTTTPYPTTTVPAPTECDTVTPTKVTTTPYPTTTATGLYNDLTPTPAAAAAEPQAACPDGWEFYQGRCYLFVNEPLAWPRALSNCAVLESTLAPVHSPQEYDFLQQLARSNAKQHAWLGGFYLQDQGIWIDGSWFHDSLYSEKPYSGDPCLVLSSSEEWSNTPCHAPGYSSICVKYSDSSPRMLCPEGWTWFHGRCYHYYQEYLTWAQADTHCAGLQASLVSVRTPEEYSFLYKQTTVHGLFPAWLGGFYLDDQWLWLDGSWFNRGFFTQMSEVSGCPCLATYSTEGWSNFNCGLSIFSFCVKDAAV